MIATFDVLVLMGVSLTCLEFCFIMFILCNILFFYFNRLK